MLMEMSLCFFHLVLKQVNVAVVAMTSINRMQKFVFLMLQKYSVVKLFNLISTTNETRHIKWHKAWKCESKFGPIFVIINNVGIKINADVNATN